VGNSLYFDPLVVLIDPALEYHKLPIRIMENYFVSELTFPSHGIYRLEISMMTHQHPITMLSVEIEAGHPETIWSQNPCDFPQKSETETMITDLPHQLNQTIADWRLANGLSVLEYDSRLSQIAKSAFEENITKPSPQALQDFLKKNLLISPAVSISWHQGRTGESLFMDLQQSPIWKSSLTADYLTHYGYHVTANQQNEIILILLTSAEYLTIQELTITSNQCNLNAKALKPFTMIIMIDDHEFQTYALQTQKSFQLKINGEFDSQSKLLIYGQSDNTERFLLFQFQGWIQFP